MYRVCVQLIEERDSDIESLRGARAANPHTRSLHRYKPLSNPQCSINRVECVSDVLLLCVGWLFCLTCELEVWIGSIDRAKEPKGHERPHPAKKKGEIEQNERTSRETTSYRLGGGVRSPRIDCRETRLYSAMPTKSFQNHASHQRRKSDQRGHEKKIKIEQLNET